MTRSHSRLEPVGRRPSRRDWVRLGIPALLGASGLGRAAPPAGPPLPGFGRAKSVLVVFTSGGPVSWIVSHLLGMGTELSNQLNPVTANASYAKVVVGARGTTLVSFNEHGHLEPDHVTYR